MNGRVSALSVACHQISNHALMHVADVWSPHLAHGKQLSLNSKAIFSVAILEGKFIKESNNAESIWNQPLLWYTKKRTWSSCCPSRHPEGGICTRTDGPDSRTREKVEPKPSPRMSNYKTFVCVGGTTADCSSGAAIALTSQAVRTTRWLTCQWLKRKRTPPISASPKAVPQHCSLLWWRRGA